MKAKLCQRLGRHIVTMGAVAISAMALSACAVPSGVNSFATAECKQISKRAEAKINWTRVPDIEIRVRDGEFSPMVTRLQQGRPYILRIRNRDDNLRVFRARDLFVENAVIAVGVEGVRAEEECPTSVSIPGRQSAEIRMVAITDGTFEFEDNFFMMPWVMSGGPGGAIIIEERRETAGLK